uniref:hypothetical protein n=1 Tax=Flavobacterium sp. TaxID=239 RepID=UPI00404B0151
MQQIKNLSIGLVISFIGSIPIGYLNLIGIAVFKKQDFTGLFSYLIGILCVEFFVILLSVYFVNKLAKHIKLLTALDFFSIIFLVLFALFFRYQSFDNQSIIDEIVIQNAFVLGFSISAINFLQIPFWVGWNLYFLNRKWVDYSKNKVMFFVLGACLGTFLGMFIFIYFVGNNFDKVQFLKEHFLRSIVPVFFLLMAFSSGFSLFKKYKMKQKS